MLAQQQDRDLNDERWQLALDAIKEGSTKHDLLLRSVQSGFNSLGTEVDQLRQRLMRLEADGVIRAKMQLWLLITNALNAMGWIAVAALLLYGLMRLFSISG